VQYAQPGQAVSYLPAPQQAVTVAPQVHSYIPAAAPVQMPQVSSYIPAPAPQVTYAPQATVVETFAPQFAPSMAATTMAAPVSYIPAPVMFQEQVVEQLGGQSVIVEQVGDWLVCEDAQGIFYHHSPTQQSFDNAPSEFLMLFPQGYAPPPLGAFAQAPQVIETFTQPQMITQAQPQMTYAAPAQVMQPQMMQPQVMMQGMVQGQPQVMVQGQPQMMTQGQFQGQLPPVMAKVLNSY